MILGLVAIGGRILWGNDILARSQLGRKTVIDGEDARKIAGETEQMPTIPLRLNYCACWVVDEVLVGRC